MDVEVPYEQATMEKIASGIEHFYESQMRKKVRVDIDSHFSRRSVDVMFQVLDSPVGDRL